MQREPNRPSPHDSLALKTAHAASRLGLLRVAANRLIATRDRCLAGRGHLKLRRGRLLTILLPGRRHRLRLRRLGVNLRLVSRSLISRSLLELLLRFSVRLLLQTLLELLILLAAARGRGLTFPWLGVLAALLNRLAANLGRRDFASTFVRRLLVVTTALEGHQREKRNRATHRRHWQT